MKALSMALMITRGGGGDGSLDRSLLLRRSCDESLEASYAGIGRFVCAVAGRNAGRIDILGRAIFRIGGAALHHSRVTPAGELPHAGLRAGIDGTESPCVPLGLPAAPFGVEPAAWPAICRKAIRWVAR